MTVCFQLELLVVSELAPLHAGPSGAITLATVDGLSRVNGLVEKEVASPEAVLALVAAGTER